MDPTLNFENVGKPLAIVKGGSHDGAILSVDEKGGGLKTLTLPHGSFQCIPPLDPTQREICFVTGQSGSGKSYWTREYARMYKKIYPQRQIYLLSKLPSDETLDQLKFLKRIKIDTLVSQPIASIECFKESLVILDDTETLGKEELAAVCKIRDDIASLGRHYVISMCVLQHLGTNGKDTRLILGEAHRFVLFPHSMGTSQFRYLLDRYLGLSKDEIAALRRVPSRWVCINKSFPASVITENAARMLVTK
jgi:hypothetical protein